MDDPKCEKCGKDKAFEGARLCPGCMVTDVAELIQQIDSGGIHTLNWSLSWLVANPMLPYEWELDFNLSFLENFGTPAPPESEG